MQCKDRKRARRGDRVRAGCMTTGAPYQKIACAETSEIAEENVPNCRFRQTKPGTSSTQTARARARRLDITTWRSDPRPRTTLVQSTPALGLWWPIDSVRMPRKGSEGGLGGQEACIVGRDRTGPRDSASMVFGSWRRAGRGGGRHRNSWPASTMRPMTGRRSSRTDRSSRTGRRFRTGLRNPFRGPLKVANDKSVSGGRRMVKPVAATCRGPCCSADQPYPRQTYSQRNYPEILQAGLDRTKPKSRDQIHRFAV